MQPKISLMMIIKFSFDPKCNKSNKNKYKINFSALVSGLIIQITSVFFPCTLIKNCIKVTGKCYLANCEYSW